jgi:SAM-dependent methyltransferase
MTYGLSHTLTYLWKGQSVARIAMNTALAEKTISGRTVDIGGGRSPDYFAYIKQQSGTTIEAVDGTLSGIDFEIDTLPFAVDTIDSILLCNVLEHIYNHTFLLSECHRILKRSGHMVGFVPFMVGFHPDPADYFRYTAPALVRLLETAGFTEIMVSPVGGGPIIASLNLVLLSIPRPFRPLLYLLLMPWDRLFILLRPNAQARTPLGYCFEGRKP